MFIVISIAVFVVVALAVFVGASLLDERSSKARLLRERLSTVQTGKEREPNQVKRSRDDREQIQIK